MRFPCLSSFILTQFSARYPLLITHWQALGIMFSPFVDAASPFYCMSKGVKLAEGRCHFGTCCPKNDDTFPGGWFSADCELLGIQGLQPGCWQCGTRNAIKFPSTGLSTRETGVFAEVAARAAM